MLQPGGPTLECVSSLPGKNKSREGGKYSVSAAVWWKAWYHGLLDLQGVTMVVVAPDWRSLSASVGSAGHGGCTSCSRAAILCRVGVGSRRPRNGGRAIKR
jgi:hypothetical protein